MCYLMSSLSLGDTCYYVPRSIGSHCWKDGTVSIDNEVEHFPNDLLLYSILILSNRAQIIHNLCSINIVCIIIPKKIWHEADDAANPSSSLQPEADSNPDLAIVVGNWTCQWWARQTIYILNSNTTTTTTTQNTFTISSNIQLHIPTCLGGIDMPVLIRFQNREVWWA